ncbi:MAG: hypothetical protein JST05_01190 [Acidobacteria bacterium]|nr:hypothetical protein [Acidobacteriota bacterium]
MILEGAQVENLKGSLLEGPKAARQRQRQQEGITIARGLAGDAVMGYRLATVEGRRELVCKHSGEVIEAAPGEGKALRYALMHMMGADPRNHAVGIVEEIHEDGRVERHEEAAAATRHSSRLNTNYIEAQRRRNRKKAKAGIRQARAAMTKAEWYQHRHPHMRGRLAFCLTTLTLPRVENPHPLLEVKRIVRALDLFRKRDSWTSHVRGAVKGIEMKVGVFMGTITIHVHAHILMLAKWWEWKALRGEWFDCIARATRDIYGEDLDREALEARVEGGVVTDIRTVKTAHHGGEVDLESALQETLKYITKPDDWEALVKAGQVGRDFLLELEEIERWPRMFELMGAARGAKTSPAKDADAEGGRGFLDTACLSDGTAQEPAEAHPLDGSLPGLLEPQAVPKGGAESAPVDSRGPPKAPRPPTWRQLMDTLPIGEWVAVVAARMASARRHIARLILERRGGIWFTLDGAPLGSGEPERSPMPSLKAPRPQAPDSLGDLWEGMDLAFA